MIRRRLLLLAGVVGPALGACEGGHLAARDTVVVYAAASLAKPMRALADSLAAARGPVAQIELGGSLEHARKLTELGRVPDVLVLADAEVLASLMPRYTSWYLAFANNRMVVAFTPRSRHAADLAHEDWPAVLTKPGVTVGRPDPSIAPAGYRALLMLQLAEGEYRHPGLAREVLAHADPRYVRPNAAELAALLEAGEVDYILDYESVARSHGFSFITLPLTIDLSDPAHAAHYARASVRVRGGSGDSVTMTGAPILYALSIPAGAPHPEAARRFVAALLGEGGAGMLRRNFVNVLAAPVLVGNGAPPEVTARVAR